jgi:hypothetical protein
MILLCPTCHKNRTGEYYGPCEGCRIRLRTQAKQQAWLRLFLDNAWPGLMDPTEKD